MPTFIPPDIGDEIKNDGEIEFFDDLQSLNYQNAFVLHSIGYPKNHGQKYFDTDVVIVCTKGVACLDVRSGDISLSKEDGEYHYDNQYCENEIEPDGPFNVHKVIQDMYVLKTELKEAGLNNIMVVCGVAFPDINHFNVDSEEIPLELVYDESKQSITKYIDGLFEYWEGRERSIRQRRRHTTLLPSDIESVKDYLQPYFSYVVTLGDSINKIDKKLINLTYEQARVLNMLANNDHMLVRGGAGTGKTVLAVEFSKTQAKTRDVLYLTYNKNLSQNLSEELSFDPPLGNGKLVVNNINSFFNKSLKANIGEKEETERSDYFNSGQAEEFRQYMSNLSEEERNEQQYDVLILDEGQDTLKEGNLDAFDCLLRGGLDNGNWAVFYDENQNIYNPEFTGGLEYFTSIPHTDYLLTKNCRNTIPIGTFAEEQSGFTSDTYLMEGGKDVAKIAYTDNEDFIKQIKTILDDLRQGEVDMDDVVILSPYKYDNKYHGRLRDNEILVRIVGDNTNKDEDFPYYCTIQGFKGLDSKIVILIDMDVLDYKNSYKELIYLAATRARTLLYVVGSEIFWNNHKGDKEEENDKNDST